MPIDIRIPGEKDSYLGRFCALDIGTVTCRMLVADAFRRENTSIALTELCKEYEIVNLGEKVDSTKMLSEEALSRTRIVLERFMDVRDAFDGVDRPIVSTSAIATSATRDAANSRVFEEMMESFGIELQVVSGEKEASLSFMGASAGFSDEKVIVLDIGGGSTEVTFGTSGKAVDYSRSFDIGSRRMTERFWDGYPCSKEKIAEARAWARAVFGEIPASVSCENAMLVAVAGTATSVVTIDLGMDVYDAEVVNGALICLQKLEDIENSLASMTLAKLESVKGLDPRRAPVIVAGFIVLEEAMKALGADAFVASESDILEGIVMYNACHRQDQ